MLRIWPAYIKKFSKASQYTLIIVGAYPRIPNTFSQDLASMVKHLLRISPHQRPNCGKETVPYNFLDKVLKLPYVISKIQKLFPNDNFEANEQNELLNTIRIPKNILYLSDRLPKPSYISDQNEEDARRNTAGQSLPFISSQKKPKQKKSKHAYIEGMGNKYKELHEEMSVEDVYMPKGSAVLPKSLKIAKRQYKKPGNDGSLLVHNKDDSKTEKEEEQDPKDNNPANSEENNKNSPRVKENVKPNKHLTSVPEGTEKKVKPEDKTENSPYIQDSYIHQLLNKKNPIIKPLNGNLQKIADIYSGNYAQQIIAIHKK